MGICNVKSKVPFEKVLKNRAKPLPLGEGGWGIDQANY